MHRTQIQLTDQQIRKLRAIAREKRISLAEAIRRCLDAQLDDAGPSRTELYKRAARLVGRFQDIEGATDVATEHDRYLQDTL